MPLNVHVPALSLFCLKTQQRKLVYRTKIPLMSPEECSFVLKIVDKYHSEKLHGRWGTVRQSSVKTSDVAVEDIIELHSWLLSLLHNKLYPLLSYAFPILADGTTLLEEEEKKKEEEEVESEEEEKVEKKEEEKEEGEEKEEEKKTVEEEKEEEKVKVKVKEEKGGKKENNDLNNFIKKYRVRVHDAFIVRYDAELEKTFSLPEHCDTSSMSIILSLNEHETRNENENENEYESVDIKTNNDMKSYLENEFTDENKNENKNENENERVRCPCKKWGSYTGGGTWFEALGPQGLVVNADIGHAVLFAGPLRHAGFPIHRGVRNILVLFLYVEGFHYGPYLRGSALQLSSSSSSSSSLASSSSSSASLSNCKENEECNEYKKGEMKASCTSSPSSSSPAAATPLTEKGTDLGTRSGSGSDKNGFVVYRQTVDLVSMLEEKEDDEDEEEQEEEEAGGEEVTINSCSNSNPD